MPGDKNRVDTVAVAAAEQLSGLAVLMTLTHAQAIGLGKAGEFKIVVTIGGDSIADFDAADFIRDLVTVTEAILPPPKGGADAD